MKKLLLGLGLWIATLAPALAGNTSPGWAPSYTPPTYFHPPGITPTPLFQPLQPGPAMPGFPKASTFPIYSPRPPPQRPGPMTVIIVKSGAKDCDDHCAEWISAEGEIEEDTPALFRKALAAAGSRKLPVLISSPGGRVLASLAIGRMIHARGLDVIVSRTTLLPCAPSDKSCSSDGLVGRTGTPLSFTSFCASACANILAAGNRRIVPPNYSLVGLHDMTVTRFWRTIEKIPVRNPFGGFAGYQRKIISSPGWQEPASAGEYKIFLGYFKEMGIKGDIVSLMHLATPEEVHWLTARELSDTGLATERLASEDYVNGIDHPAGSPVAVPSTPAPQSLSAPPIPAQTQVVGAVPPASPPTASGNDVLEIHVVQTQETHVSANTLPLLQAPSESDAPPTGLPPSGLLLPSRERPAVVPASQSPPTNKLAALIPATRPDASPKPTPKSATVKPVPKAQAHTQRADKPVTACSASFRTIPASGMRKTGEVRVVLPLAAATLVLQRAEESTRVPANPKYFGYDRLGLWIYDGAIPEPGSAVAPRGMRVQPGDTVSIVTRHQDTSMSCHFVPNLVVAVKHKY